MKRRQQFCGYLLAIVLGISSFLCFAHALASGVKAEPGYSEPSPVAYGQSTKAPLGGSIRFPDFDLFMPANWKNTSRKGKGGQREKVSRISFRVSQAPVWVSKTPAIPIRQAGDWYEWDVPIQSAAVPLNFKFDGKCFTLSQPEVPAPTSKQAKDSLPLAMIQVDEVVEGECESSAKPKRSR